MKSVRVGRAYQISSVYGGESAIVVAVGPFNDTGHRVRAVVLHRGGTTWDEGTILWPILSALDEI